VCWALLRLGRVDEAQAVLTQAEQVVQAWLPEGHRLRLHVLGMTAAVRQQQGRRQESVEAARAALELARKLPASPLAVAEAQLLLASSLGAQDASAWESGRLALAFFTRAGERARQLEAPSWLRSR
jgi:hypothetical protein